jgi:trk system potassium uptake protein TrkA
MPQQVIIIGLGQFGMSLAHELTDKGAEVIAVDKRQHLVEEAASFVEEAVALDATDEADLARLNPAKRDAAVCAIGDDSREASIVCTALLRQIGSPLVIARACDAMHQRILTLVGAHQVIHPEQEFGKRFANRLLYRHLIAETRIGDDLQLTEIKVQPFMIGRSLVELELPKRFGIMVAAIRRGNPPQIIPLRPAEPLQAEDNLVIVSNDASIQSFMKGV